MRQSDRSKTVMMLLTAALGLIALAYMAKGFQSLIFTDPLDLRSRWVEQKYIYRGQYPPDVALAHSNAADVADHRSGRNSEVDPNLGVPPLGVYPPWAFFSGFLWLLPNWRASCISFAAWNLAALALIVGWACRVGFQVGGPARGLFLAASIAAISSGCTTLRNGQYGVLLIGLLAASALLAERRRNAAAGLLLGIALLKPTMSAPFLIAFLVKRRFGVLLAAAAYIALGIGVIWHITGANVLDMLREWAQSTRLNGVEGYGPSDMLWAAGVSPGMAIGIPAIGGIVIGLLAASGYRRIPILPLFGVLSSVARLWAYHRHYDNIVLAFLLLALGERIFRREDRLSTPAFFMVGLSLWAPAKATTYVWFRGFQFLAWIVGAAVLCLQSRYDSDRTTERAPAAGITGIGASAGDRIS